MKANWNIALVAVLAVIVQGILGGLRVTGRFTVSTSPEAMAPSITLAIVHGVLGPAFFALMIALAVFTSTAWASAAPARATPHAGSEHVFGLLLVGAVAVQLVLGAIQRHLARGLLVHITFAVVVLVSGEPLQRGNYGVFRGDAADALLDGFDAPGGRAVGRRRSGASRPS